MWASVVVVSGLSSRGSQALERRLSSCELSCSTAYEIFLAQGSNPCLLHWQVDSLPLSQQGSPKLRNVDKRLAEPLQSSHGPSLQTRVLLKHIFFNSLSLQNTAFSQNNSILKAPTREETLIYFANKRSSLCFTVFFQLLFPHTTPPPFFVP